MFAARYGFYPDSVVPFGRLQPYVAVGPAILISSQEPTLNGNLVAALLGPPPTRGPSFPYTAAPGPKTSVDIALAAEVGVRYMALKNVSLEASFKYRWSQPTYNYSGFADPTILPAGFTQGYSLNPTYHLFSFQVGAAYHF